MTSLNKSLVAAVVGGALALAPTAAPAQDKNAPAPTNEDLKKQLDRANQKLDDLKQDVKRLTELVDGRRDEKTNTRIESDPGLVEEIKRLKDTVYRLETQLSRMSQNTSLRPPGTGNGTTPALTGRGTVRVVNEYPTPVSMVVNNTNYRVEPNSKLDIDVPTGDFTYHLLQAGIAPIRSVIKEKEVVTLRIK